MKATRDFFKEFRKEIELGEKDILHTTNECLQKNKEIYDLFAGCGSLDLEDESIKKLMTLIKATLDARDAEIEHLQSQIKTTDSEKRFVYNFLSLGELVSKMSEWNGEQNISEEDDIDKEYDTPEELMQDIIQKLVDSQQREQELRTALKDERKKNKPEDGLERKTITDFLDYAEENIPAHQYQDARFLKGVLFDMYDVSLLDKSTQDRLRKLDRKNISYSQNTTNIYGDQIGNKILENYGPNYGIESGANVITSDNTPQIQKTR